jgi:hypothetical protein
MVFDFTWSRLEPTIYRTPDEHVNHYNTDTVMSCPIIRVVKDAVINGWIHKEDLIKLFSPWYNLLGVKQQSLTHSIFYHIKEVTILY